MKATGIVRKLDDLNRLVIPKELTRTFNIVKNQPMEIFVEGDQIILQKYESGCVFCGTYTESVFMNKLVCSQCKGGI